MRLEYLILTNRIIERHEKNKKIFSTGVKTYEERKIILCFDLSYNKASISFLTPGSLGRLALSSTVFPFLSMMTYRGI